MIEDLICQRMYEVGYFDEVKGCGEAVEMSGQNDG